MVQIGVVKSSFKFEELELTTKKVSKDDKIRSIKREFKPATISPEINVIGQNVDEACFAIDKYLDTCALNGLGQIRIVHGKGTGALRSIVSEYLKKAKFVESFRLGGFGEGDTGATIVTFKK